MVSCGSWSEASAHRQMKYINQIFHMTLLKQIVTEGCKWEKKTKSINHLSNCTTLSLSGESLGSYMREKSMQFNYSGIRKHQQAHQGAIKV